MLDHMIIMVPGYYTYYTPFASLSPFSHDHHPEDNVFDRVVNGFRALVVRNRFKSPESEKKLILISATLSGFIPLLLRAFPNAKIIHLQRNPFAVIASYTEYMPRTANAIKDRDLIHTIKYDQQIVFHSLRWMRFRFPGNLGIRPDDFGKALNMSYIHFLCWYYTSLDAQIRQDISQVLVEKRLHLSYERLVYDFEREINKVLGFIGVNANTEWVKKMSSGVKKGALAKFKKILSESELEEIRQYLFLQGYDVDSYLGL